jgi:hypothetical protein
MKGALLTGAASGFVALIASGVVSFWLVSQVIALPDAPRTCPSAITERCFGSLTIDDLVKPLRARGFDCNDVPTCDLSVGGGGYRVFVVSRDAAVSSYSVEARFDHNLGPSQRALDLVSWFAALPFGHDPATASAARSWTVQQVRAHAHTLATINGYGYELEGRGDQSGALLSECLPGHDCTVTFHGYFRLRVQVGSP